MSTSKQTVEELLELLAPLDVRARSMFGEYGMHCDDKFIACICDDRFFLKPTPAADSVADELEACPPYPGAKDYWLLDERFTRNRARFRKLVQATADALPKPKSKTGPKRKRAPRKKA